MKTQIIFANGVTMETGFAPFGGNTTYQSAYRRTLELRFPSSDISYEEIKALYTNTEATSEISVTEYGTQIQEDPDNSGETIEVEVITGQSLHLNYTLPMELTLKTVDGTELWCMKMAQKSAIEIAQEQQAADINDTQLALIELAGMIEGGTQ